MNVDKTTALAVIREVEAAADEVFAKHGLQRKPARSTYGETLSIRLVGIALKIDEKGINQADPSVADYKRYARGYGLPEDGLGQTIMVGQRRYTVEGLKPSRSKYPVLVRRDDGKQLLLTVEAAKGGFLRGASV